MDNYITLIGSIVIGTLLMLSVLNFQTDIKEHSYEKNTQLILQNRATNLIDQIEWDFRQIGYGVNYDALAVYDSSWIAYYIDIGNDGVIDTVHYELSDTLAAASTTNPRDRVLRRWSNSDPQSIFLFGVTDFSLKYFDGMGNEIADLKKIKTIEVSVEFESPEPIKKIHDGDGNVTYEYAKYFWREKVTPMNLQPI